MDLRNEIHHIVRIRSNPVELGVISDYDAVIRFLNVFINHFREDDSRLFRKEVCRRARILIDDDATWRVGP